ncbi:hypothetical protein SpCBS45565_g08200 [Spizellomyces sp. 'palustris']|nr:hypothetical protein SpCBS45565_g08200 [Spizellomyces sp. 'palustris']
MNVPRQVGLLVIALLFRLTVVFADTPMSAFAPIRFYDFVDHITIIRHSVGSLSLSFRAINQTFELDLIPNDALLHPSAVLQVQGEQTGEGAYQSNQDIHAMAANAYKGDVLGVDVSGMKRSVGWARIMFHKDTSQNVFEGSFSIWGEMYHIKEIEVYKKTRRSVDVNILPPDSRSLRHQASRLILFKDHDQTRSLQFVPDQWGLNPLDASSWMSKRDVQAVSTCAFDPSANAVARREYSDSLERRAAGLVKRAPSGCPSSRRVLFMAAAGDCTYVKLHGGKEKALTQILLNWNTASRYRLTVT